MKTITFLLVLFILYSCNDPKGVSYQEAKKAKEHRDSIKGMNRGEISFDVNEGGPFATMDQINKLAENKQIYYFDPRTNLCFAATSSRTSYGHYVLSIVCVPCDSLRNVRLFVLKTNQ